MLLLVSSINSSPEYGCCLRAVSSESGKLPFGLSGVLVFILQSLQQEDLKISDRVSYFQRFKKISNTGLLPLVF